jgi:hypothetical protein
MVQSLRYRLVCCTCLSYFSLFHIDFGVQYNKFFSKFMQDLVFMNSVAGFKKISCVFPVFPVPLQQTKKIICFLKFILLKSSDFPLVPYYNLENSYI